MARFRGMHISNQTTLETGFRNGDGSIPFKVKSPSLDYWTVVPPVI